MKKILFVTPTMNFGGAERVMSILANHWIEQENEVSFLLTQSNESVYDLSPKINVYSIYSVVSNGGIVHLNIIREIRRFVKNNRPDFVICFFNDVCALTLAALRGTQIPVIYSERNDPNKVNQKIIDRLYRKYVEIFSERFVFQSDGAKSCYNNKVQEKSVVILNPFDTQKLPCHSYMNCEKSIVSVGRLTVQKRQDILIKAFDIIADKHKEYKLKIYGDGELRESLQSLICELGREDRIFLMGNDEAVLEKVADSEIFVLTSDFEGVPNVLIEAMALGLPSISTDCSPGGARMLIDSQVNGVLVSCGDINAVAENISMLIENKHFAKKLGTNAKIITNIVCIGEISKKWMDMLDNIY